jgi:hypothetical protein
VRLRITNLEYLGSERIIYAVMEGGRFDGKKVVARLTTATSGGFQEGTSHDFAVSDRDLKFFDKATQRRTAPRELTWR